jgi:hypothetical protein
MGKVYLGFKKGNLFFLSGKSRIKPQGSIGWESFNGFLAGLRL